MPSEINIVKHDISYLKGEEAEGIHPMQVKLQVIDWLIHLIPSLFN